MEVVKVSKKTKNKREFQTRRDILRREQEYGRANLAKYTKKWSKMLNEISCDHLRTEALSFWHSFNKAVDYKDMEISLYLDWIEEENQRYWKNVASHNHRMEYLISFLHRNHTNTYKKLGAQVNKLIALWVKNYDLNRIRAITNEEYLDTMKYQIECIKKNEEFERITKNFSIIDEKTSKFKFQFGDITYILSDKFEKLHYNIKDFTFDYFASTGKRQKIWAESLLKYQCLQKDIVANLKRKAQLEALTHQLLRKFNEFTDKNEQKLEDVEKERNSLHECFMLLRDNLFYDKNNDLLKRQVLSVTFNESFQKLENLAKKGATMLKCLSACRKYETVQEKIFPYPEQIVPEKYEDPKNQIITRELNLFWSRVSTADLKRYTLNEERTYLKAENKKLRKQIHSYCECLKCPSLPQIPQRAGKIPYTEGREMLKKQKAHLNRRK